MLEAVSYFPEIQSILYSHFLYPFHSAGGNRNEVSTVASSRESPSKAED